MIEDIADILFKGFRPYVHHSKKMNYDDMWAKRKRHDTKFIMSFFPKYVNEKVWMSKPKERRDTYLFNYYFIEVPSEGLKYSKLLQRYVHDIHPRLPKRLNKK